MQSLKFSWIIIETYLMISLSCNFAVKLIKMEFKLLLLLSRCFLFMFPIIRSSFKHLSYGMCFTGNFNGKNKKINYQKLKRKKVHNAIEMRCISKKKQKQKTTKISTMIAWYFPTVFPTEKIHAKTIWKVHLKLN